MIHDTLLLSLQDTIFRIKIQFRIQFRIFTNKKKIKRKNVSIAESLTMRRVIELKKAGEMYDFRNMWSHDSKVLFLYINGKNKVKVFYH